MPAEKQSTSDEILHARQISRDTDRSYTVRFPHCSQLIGLEGDDFNEIRGKQHQHKRCGGWLVVSCTASFVHELPEAFL